jgi:Bax protein
MTDADPDPHPAGPAARFGPRWRTYAAVGGITLTLVAAVVGHLVHVHLDTGGLGYVEAADLVVETDDVDARKRHFFERLAPVVAAENARILAERERLLAARAAGNDAVARDIAEDYDFEWKGDAWGALLKRVDVVPMRLALAQAAKESGWGRSRFARQGNNLFGQWCFSEGCGLVPKNRPDGDTHEVQAFDSVNHAVRSYLKNINTHRAYRALRGMRARARAAGRAPRAADLARTMTSYSERGEAYVRDILAMIRANADLMPKTQALTQANG